MKKKNNKSKLETFIVGIVYLINLIVFGAFLSKLAKNTIFDGSNIILHSVSLLVIIFILCYFMIVVHEFGHMICGFISGYTFKSIRFANFIIFKKDGKLKIGKYSLSGTGGQCIMAPPDLPTDKVPTTLYNCGGLIANLIATLVAVGVFFITDSYPNIKYVAVLAIFAGIWLVTLNGMPLEVLSNDGYNALKIRKDIKAKKAFVVSLKIVSQIQDGVSPKDFPEEWFDTGVENGDSALALSILVQKLSWLINNQRFEEAYELSVLLSKKKMLAPVYKLVVKSEKLFAMIMLNHESDRIKREYRKIESDIKKLKKLPSTHRINYAYYLLVENDEPGANKEIDKFEKIAKSYPYTSEIVVERELIDVICNKHQA